jgi:hypothetical protein
VVTKPIPNAIHQIMKGGLLSDEATVIVDSLSKLDYLSLEDANGSLVKTACELNASAAVVRCMKMWLHKEEILEVALWRPSSNGFRPGGIQGCDC